jgi:hypothetical protein
MLRALFVARRGSAFVPVRFYATPEFKSKSDKDPHPIIPGFGNRVRRVLNNRRQGER